MVKVSKPIYIVAPHYGLAQEYARRHGIPLPSLRYIHNRQDMLPLGGGVEVLWLTDDRRGWFDYPPAMSDVIETMRLRSKAGYIAIKSVSMDDPVLPTS